jgi:hypothetical protein
MVQIRVELKESTAEECLEDIFSIKIRLNLEQCWVTARKVAGKNHIVIIAMYLIATLSLEVTLARNKP